MNYFAESKVLQYFSNAKHNSAALDTFTKILKVINYTGLWNANFTWYSPSATHPICIYGLEQQLRNLHCPVGWGCRIHWLLLCRGVNPPPTSVLDMDTTQSDGEVPAVLQLWGIRSTPSLPSLPDQLWPRVVVPDKGPIYGLNRTNSILMLKWILWVNWIAWNRNVFHN